VAFEFRFKASESHRHWWDKAFIAGSFIATFFQGVPLGAFMHGVPVVNRAYAGHAFDWLAPFPLFTGLGLLVAYAMLGCTWLIFKTEGELYQRVCRLARPLLFALLAVIAAISLWTPLIHPKIADRWFSLPNVFWFAPVPVLVVVAAWQLLKSLQGKPHVKPFLLTLGLVFLGYSGLGISVWPNVIPPDISIWQASAPPQSQGFALVGALLILPLILMYTAWSYYVFRGKVKEGDGYH
jgi:cytochrome d ubiquinol oxidase subunit II